MIGLIYGIIPPYIDKIESNASKREEFKCNSAVSKEADFTDNPTIT